MTAVKQKTNNAPRHAKNSYFTNRYCKLSGIFIFFYLLIFLSCASRTTDNTLTSTDKLDILAQLIKTSNPALSELTVTPDSTDPKQTTLLLSGFVNNVTGERPAWTLNIDQTTDITTVPPNLVIGVSQLIAPEKATNTLVVTFNSDNTASYYTLKTSISGAPVKDWFTKDTLATYLTASFASQSATLTLSDDNTVTLSSLTNTADGSGAIRITSLPPGFKVTPTDRIDLPDPDGAKTDAVTFTPDVSTFTITETTSEQNSQSYTIAPISLSALMRFTPNIHIAVIDTADNNPINGLSITLTDRKDSTDNPIIAITGLTNTTNTGGIAKTYRVNIAPQPNLFTLSPPTGNLSITLTEPAGFSPGLGMLSTSTFSIIDQGKTVPTTYALEVSFSGAPVNEWFTATNFMTYITGVNYEGQTTTMLSLDNTTLSITGNLTNVPTGSLSLTTNASTFPPTGYEVLEFDSLSDPDNEGISAITTSEVGTFTLRETSRPTNAQTYKVTISLLAYNSPVQPSHVNATFNGVRAPETDIAIEGATITVSGFSNLSGTGTPGTLTITPPSSMYTADPSTAITFTDPAGIMSSDITLDPVTITSHSLSVSHTIVIRFMPEVTQLKITSSDIMNSPVTIETGGSITVTNRCQILEPSIAEVLPARLGGVVTVFPAYYDRFRDERNAINNYIISKPVTIADGNGNVIDSTFTVNIEFPPCTTTNFAGTGVDSNNAFQIDNAAKLELVSYIVNYSNNQKQDPSYTTTFSTSFYQVTTNIDMGLAGLPWSQTASRTGFIPIGRKDKNFSGTFDCMSHTITGLYINRPTTDYIGLFGSTSNAAIENCPLIDVAITGDINVGGLVGFNSNSSIRDSYVTGRVSSASSLRSYVGGLIGVNKDSATVTNVYAAVDVSAPGSYVGGLVGWNQNSSLTTTYATGTVSISTNERTSAGGLVGVNIGDNSGGSSVISNSYATGRVSGYNTVGGLVGWNYGSTVSQSYATGAVSGHAGVGGLVGGNDSNATITDAYATGTVSGANDVGGLVGKNDDGSITNAYVTGNVSGSTHVGLFIGNNGIEAISNNIIIFINNGDGVEASYFSSDATLTVRGSVSTETIGVGSDDSSAMPPIVTTNLTAQTTAQLRSGTFYSGWDTSTNWVFTVNMYPRLKTVACATRQYITPIPTECQDL
ncbi:hypothetical protein COTS27_00527 [Spirochaetota bacterium]|nr:hypothetical protein COTS27_00527 [Spirochaetota bacterium]